MYDMSAVARSRMADRMHEAEAYRLAKEARATTRPSRGARRGHGRVAVAWVTALTRFVRGADRVAVAGRRSARRVAFPA